MKRRALPAIIAFNASLMLAMGALAQAPSDRLFSINDGGFENGTCGAGSGWTCWSSTSCQNWIIDPTESWGIPAYEGEFVAQLGGMCEEEPNSNTICQEIKIDWPCGFWITWKWMGIAAGDDPGKVTLTVDGVSDVSVYPSGTVEDTGGVWKYGWVSAWTIEGVYTFCFEFTAGSGSGAVLIDAIGRPISPTPAWEQNLSAVKSLYR